MIVSGQITREDALKELSKPMYEENIMREYIKIIKSRLCISDEEFKDIMSAPTHSHSEYKTDKIEPILRKIIGEHVC